MKAHSYHSVPIWNTWQISTHHSRLHPKFPFTLLYALTRSTSYSIKVAVAFYRTIYFWFVLLDCGVIEDRIIFYASLQFQPIRSEGPINVFLGCVIEWMNEWMMDFIHGSMDLAFPTAMMQSLSDKKCLSLCQRLPIFAFLTSFQIQEAVNSVMSHTGMRISCIL